MIKLRRMLIFCIFDTIAMSKAQIVHLLPSYVHNGEFLAGTVIIEGNTIFPKLVVVELLAPRV